MIGTIRKHSKWLLWLIAGATIFSFVYFMGQGPMRSGGGGETIVSSNIVSGEIYGEKVTLDKYNAMEKDINLAFLFQYGQWATGNPNVSQDALLREIYPRMMLVQKARDLGVYVNDEQVSAAAANFLRSPGLLRALNVRGQSVPFNDFVTQVLAPKNLTAADFENFIRDELSVQQLQQIYGLSGELVTPQEATNEYVRENQELSAQIVFFSASNYLADAVVAPGEVGLFYTNYMAEYRLPERRQASYVLFSVSNYLAQATRELTNLNLQVDSAFNKYGMQAVPDAKTPEEAKAKIRDVFLRQRALEDAGQQANDFAGAVYNVSNGTNTTASAQDLVTVARQKGLKVQTTTPFSAEYGPEEFVAPAVFTRTVFGLTPDGPISEPVASSDGVYLIALDNILPSEIPPLDEIRSHVTEDLKLREATYFALNAGTNFVRTLGVQMAAGKSFIAACIIAGKAPEELQPFAISTQEMPELEGRATLNQIKQAAFTTPVGLPSGFVQTQDGGFVIYVESKLPIDEAKMAEELPQFTDELRQRRAEQAYGDWRMREASRELRTTPLAKDMGVR